MYKLLSRLIYNRISPGIFGYQSFDQYGFTPNIRLEDALLTAEVSIEHVLEFNVPLWVMSLDLRKAFGSVTHSAVFDALRDHGVEESYISLIARLYEGQTGTVHDSKDFKISRGVKQGDVLSVIIFNCVLDIAFEK